MKNSILLFLSLLVSFGAFSQTPDWQVNPNDYSNDMAITGIVEIFDQEIRGENHMLAAFVGEECRGVTRPIYIDAFDRYFVLLQIRSNESSGEKITFRFYDADKDETYSLFTTEEFSANSVLGNFKEPYLFTNVDKNDKVSDFESFSFKGIDDVEIVLDKINHTVTAKVPVNTDLTNLIAIFSFKDNTYSAFVNDIAQTSGTTINDFNETVTYIIKNKYRYETEWTVNVSINKEAITSTMDLEEGWNWISFNQTFEGSTKTNDILNGLGQKSDIIIGQNGFDLYSEETGWEGTLSRGPGIDVRSMYRLRLSAGSSFSVTAPPASVSDYSIELKTGWNYVGFIPQESMSVKDALASINPENGDLIKSHDAVSVYSETDGWVGGLQTMNPFNGYMIHLNRNATLRFPLNASTPADRKDKSSDYSLLLPEKAPLERRKYERNMSMITTIENADEFGLNGSEILFANIGETIRGFASPSVTNSSTIYLLPVLGNTEKIPVSFQLFDSENEIIYTVKENIDFDANGIHGSFEEPFSLLITSKEMINEKKRPVVSPNPFNDRLSVQLTDNPEQEISIRLIGSSGTVVLETSTKSDSEGLVEISLADNIITAGLYILHLEGQSISTKQMVFKR
ncbi:hypothetical protein FUAX_20580 [Fulvitalea axinellae]|uniref:Secretion system C-terminal sorting domain-containing protein n=1 Tax=Fulvitalea axinellae TaxID=1182444 RepID=A0AAU9D9Q0_9BACT|nr:hypothetical protein FUAX_20580 [Fulvitalea axinellae]